MELALPSLSEVLCGLARPVQHVTEHPSSGLRLWLVLLVYSQSSPYRIIKLARVLESSPTPSHYSNASLKVLLIKQTPYAAPSGLSCNYWFAEPSQCPENSGTCGSGRQH